ncbi:DEAD-box ATP-dependent RNA helicase 38, partial [Tanacetum coccineum]
VTDFSYPQLESYEDLGLSDELLRAMFDDFFMAQRPPRMHAVTLRIINSKVQRSLIAQARKSSGKDFCYMISILHRISITNTNDNPQAIVMCPTTKIAHVICDLVKRYGKYTDVLAEVVDDQNRQIDLISHIVIGTPNVLRTLILRKKINPSHIKMVVIDKVDHLLECSMRVPSIDVMEHIHSDCQVSFCWDIIPHYGYNQCSR